MNILLFKVFLVLQTSIYSLHFTDNSGTDNAFSSFQGKKILIVNTASDSKYRDQYGKLEQLYQKYKDSLIIIAFPSNDFGQEPKDDQDIKDDVVNNYDIHYILAAKLSVSGDAASNLYKWLTQSAQNGIMDNPVPGDFTKFLIDGQGNIIGIFAGIVDPISNDIQDAITNYQN